jgi:hypothetical protein
VLFATIPGAAGNAADEGSGSAFATDNGRVFATVEFAAVKSSGAFAAGTEIPGPNELAMLFCEPPKLVGILEICPFKFSEELPSPAKGFS